MLSRDYRDIVGGGLLLFLGGWIAWYASTNFDMGTIRRMGPGFFPTGVGLVLSLFGLGIMIPAFFRQGEGWPSFEPRSTAAVLASVAAFALVVPRFGLLPAIATLVIVASLAETTFRPVAIVGSVVFLSALAYLIFSLALGLPLAMVRF